MAHGKPLDAGSVIYRWDLDKTYLRTEFDTFRDLLRTAFEPPSEKRTVPGASALLREIRATGPRGVYILSGSPSQMRRVLEAKLRLDGIEWDGFTLKPSLQNLVRGRVRFLRDQVSYKLGALLSARNESDPGAQEVLFGDDAEADAFIYSLYADIVAGRVSAGTLLEVLEQARVYPQHQTEVMALAERVEKGAAVRRIFIHLDRVSSLDGFTELGARVCPFYNYFQPALVLVEEGLLPAAGAFRVGADLVLEHGFNPEALIASFTELSRRGFIGPRCGSRIVRFGADLGARRLSSATPVLAHFASEVERKLPHLSSPAPVEPMEIDYVELFGRDRARAKAAKLRALWRRR